MKVSRPIHLEIQTHRLKPVGILRSSFREGDKIKHTNHGRITGLSLSQLKLLQAAFRGEVIPKESPEAFQILYSKEYGASYALLQLAKELGMDRALYSRKEPWVQDCLAMIAGRVRLCGKQTGLIQPTEEYGPVGVVRRHRASRCRETLLPADGSALGTTESHPTHLGWQTPPERPSCAL